MHENIKSTKSAGGVVLNLNAEVLVVSQHGTSWSLPKGHIEEGENALEAAKREVFEEAGVSDIESIRELGTYQRYTLSKDGREDMSELKTITMFLFKTNESSLRPVDKENPEARWVKKENEIG